MLFKVLNPIKVGNLSLCWFCSMKLVQGDIRVEGNVAKNLRRQGTCLETDEMHDGIMGSLLIHDG